MLHQIFPQLYGNAQYPNVHVIEDIRHYPYFYMSIGWNPAGPNEDAVNAVYERLNQTAEIMHNFYLDAHNLYPNVNNADITITHRDHEALVNNRFTWGVVARHRLYGFVNRFIESADQALQNLTNSEGILEFDEIVWNISLRGTQLILGTGALRTRQNALLRGGRGIGLIQDMTPKTGSTKNCCGWICLLQALMSRSILREAWIGELDWLMEYVTDPQHPFNKLRGQKVKRLLIDRLKQEFDINGDEWLLQPGHGHNADTGTVHQLIKKQPKLQIVIFNEANKALNDRQTGSQWKWQRGETATVYLSLDIDFNLKSMGHLRLIKSPVTFFAHADLRHDKFYCDSCLRLHTTTTKCSGRTYQCDLCGLEHEDNEALQLHMTVEGYSRPQCEKCLNRFYNPACLALHRCPARYLKRCPICQKIDTPNHPCENEYVCRMCKCRVKLATPENPYIDKHQCYVQKPENPGIVPEHLDIVEYGKQYYAFDTESELHVDAAGRNLMKHVVNFVHVKQCFTDKQWDFDTLEDFMTWVMQIREQSTFFAHNLKGYDGRLVWECAQKVNLGVECVWRGSQILQMKAGLITFADTLLHFPQALDQLPISLNMDQTQFKKGFFPYKFCTVENRNYIGEIPAILYYEPDKMKVQKRLEFYEWYPNQLGKPYNLRAELISYCRSDVNILKKAIETYLQVQSLKKPLDPWKSMTMASYALQMYRMYYMPANSIGILDSKTTLMIKESMHGGRTDARCLIREWTPEQIKQGYYGRYQDVQSLYPTVQFYDDMPIGQPEIVYYAEQQPQPNLEGFYGFVCCDIKCTRYLHHPIVVNYDSEKNLLLADLNEKKNICIPSPELHLALENGYVITKVYWTMKFKASKDLFKSYFRDFLKDKLESSGVPGWIQSEEDWLQFRQYHIDNLGITLERQNMIKNNSRKTGAKLLCNSLWGKFGETQKASSFRQFTVGVDDSEYMAMLSRRGDQEIRIKKMFQSENKLRISVIYQETGEDLSRPRLRRINLAIASMVTSHARCRLWKQLNKLADRVLYHDTDSIVYENAPNGYNIPIGKYLGEWECETGGLPISKFVSTGPKSYSYCVLKADGTLKECTKAKGIQASYDNMKQIGYEQMKNLVLKRIEKYQTNNLLFKYEQRHGAKEGQMSTGELIKDFRVTYSKGLIDPETMKIYPFGCEVYMDDNNAIKNRLCLWSDINMIDQ